MPRRSQDKPQADKLAIRMGESLRHLRLARGSTQADLAELAGVSLDAYARVERGQALPSFPTLMRLCELLDVSPDALLVKHDVDAPASSGTSSNPRGRRSGGVRVITAVPSARRKSVGQNYPTMRNPSPPDDPDEPEGAAPRGRIRLGAREQAYHDYVVEILLRLDRDDRAAVGAMVRHLAVKAGVMPPAPKDVLPWGTPVVMAKAPSVEAKPSNQTTLSVLLQATRRRARASDNDRSGDDG